MKYIDNDEFTPTYEAPGVVIGKLKDTSKRLGYLSGGGLVAHFDGLGQFLETMPKFAGEARRDKASSKQIQSGFNLLGYSAALDTFTHNPSKVRQFDEKDTRLPGDDASGLSIGYDVTGDMLDVGRYVDGEPEVFSSLTDGAPRGKRVNIILDLNQLYSITPDYVLRRSRRLVRLVDWLESQNIRVQIMAFYSNQCAHIEIDAKLYHEPLDLNTIAVMAHPDFTRRLGFRMLEYSDRFDGGYGHVRLFNDKVTRLSNGLLEPEEAEIMLYVGSREGQDIDLLFNSLEEQLPPIFMGEVESSHLAVMG